MLTVSPELCWTLRPHNVPPVTSPHQRFLPAPSGLSPSAIPSPGTRRDKDVSRCYLKDARF